jgi:hypothetical protein
MRYPTKGIRGMDIEKKYIQELDEKYPTGSNRQSLTKRGRSIAKWKEQQMIGSQGAASEVRKIDPSTIDLSKYGVTR